MGKFDGYLICSDLDGTFRNKINIEPNLKAVRYFTENGGKFTFATGRTVSHLEKLDYSSIVNAPACICNGGVVYDSESKSVLYEGHVDFSVKEFINDIKKYDGDILGINIYNSCFENEYRFQGTDSVCNEIMATKPLKLICVFSSPEEADNFKMFACERELFRNCYIGKSWNVGVEFNFVNSTKGNALDFIKAHLGNIHNTIGIGDYENDIPLLQHADLGVAVSNALDCVKEAADLIVKPCEESALEDLINILDRIL